MTRNFCTQPTPRISKIKALERYSEETFEIKQLENKLVSTFKKILEFMKIEDDNPLLNGVRNISTCLIMSDTLNNSLIDTLHNMYMDEYISTFNEYKEQDYPDPGFDTKFD